MPRPKPAEELRGREIRMSDSQMAKFKSLGGAKWLRDFLDGKTKMKEKPCQPVVTTIARTTAVTRDGIVLPVWRHIMR